MNKFLLHAQQLSVGYHGHPLLRNLEITLRPGQILTLIGPNGAGKSTVLKSLIRQLKPISGTVYLGKDEMSTTSADTIARRMSIVMTERIQPELMTCRDIVRTGRYPYTGRLGTLSAHDEACVDDAMDLVHISDLSYQLFTQLSDGQRQRVMLARAICQEPEVMVLDEPTSYLDIRHKLELLAVLKKLVREKQLAVILTLHELELAQKCSDTVLCIRNGSIERSGSPEAVLTGDYIRQLYDMTCGSYDPYYGSLELDAPKGFPKLFVIAGAGTGIPVYRRLQRMEIPFLTGVLHENDLDFPVAKALAAQVISQRAFEPISQDSFHQAMSAMEQCEQVICSITQFGSVNQRNFDLLHIAEQKGILTTLEQLSSASLSQEENDVI